MCNQRVVPALKASAKNNCKLVNQPSRPKVAISSMTEAPERTFPQLNLSLTTSPLAVRRVLEFGGKPALARLPLSSLHPTIGIEKRGAESLAPEWSTFVQAAQGEVGRGWV